MDNKTVYTAYVTDGSCDVEEGICIECTSILDLYEALKECKNFHKLDHIHIEFTEKKPEDVTNHFLGDVKVDFEVGYL